MSEQVKETTLNVICFTLGLVISTATAWGFLGVDPYVSDNTKQICKHHEGLSRPCNSR